MSPQKTQERRKKRSQIEILELKSIIFEAKNSLEQFNRMKSQNLISGNPKTGQLRLFTLRSIKNKGK